MTIATYRVRFMANNSASLNVNAYSFSSEAVGFESINAFNSFRSSTWKMTGYFEIYATNNLLYINDGSDKTATVPVAGYKTAAALATAIQTALNAVSSLWAVTYDLAGASYTFTITRGGSATLRLSQTTNAIWSTIGITSITDSTGTTFLANEQRTHTNEFVTFDFGYISPVTFIGIISGVDVSFNVSSTATISLQGNNINDFASPAFSTSLTRTDSGVFQFNIATPSVAHRYWRFNIVDYYNAVTGPFIEIGSLYLGDFLTLSERNIEAGFSDTLNDPSLRSESEGGVLYFDKRTRYTSLSDVTLSYLLDSDKQIIKDVFRTVGTTEPFYISLDPELKINSDITEFTKFVIFNEAPSFIGLGAGYFSTKLSFREVV